METTETYGDTLARLNKQLDDLGTAPSGNPVSMPTANQPAPQPGAPSSVVPTTNGGSKFVFTFSPLYIYGAIPILVIVILMITQPNFLKEEVEENGEKKMKINFKKFLAWTLGFSIVLMTGVFGYFYQQNKKKDA